MRMAVPRGGSNVGAGVLEHPYTHESHEAPQGPLTFFSHRQTGEEEENENDTWGSVAFVGLESPVLKSLLIYPLFYEAFYFLASLFSSKFS